MSDYGWLDPDFNIVSTVITVATAAALIHRAIFRAPRGYRRLVRARELGRTDVVRRAYRAALTRQAVLTGVVLFIVAVDGGVSHTDVGLASSSGAAGWGWAAYAGVLLAASTLYLRARAKRGQSVPGQRNFVALVARDGERWAAAAVAVGAGISEELLFRGLFTAFAVDVLGLGAGLAVFVLSPCFGIMHVYQGWLAVLATTIVGFAFGSLYLSTRSLLIPILLHALVDLRGLVAVPAATGAAQRRH